MRAHKAVFANSEAPFNRPRLTTASLTLAVLVIWALSNEYRGLVLDGQIYAVQALAKLRPPLNSDLFLQNTNQDQYTLFPRIYSWFITLLGLGPAALFLTSICSIWFLYASWKSSESLFDRNYAWLTLFVLIVSGGHYGAAGVFHFLEPFLTARLPTEALIATALAIHLTGHEKISLLLAVCALFLHPLVALPGLLLLLCLRVSPRLSASAAAVGVLGCLVAALATTRFAPAGRLLPVLDSEWLDVVKERSQFLFLQQWTVQDWELNLRPFVCLALASMTLHERPTRKLALCAMQVGLTGLLIAAIASLIAPVAILLQGQAWRWLWVTDYVSVILLLPTVRLLWTSHRLGITCALMMVAAWSFSADIGFIYASMALMIWLSRDAMFLGAPYGHRIVLTATVISITTLAAVQIVSATSILRGTHPLVFSLVSILKFVFATKVSRVTAAIVTWYYISKAGATQKSRIYAGVLAAVAILLCYVQLAPLNLSGSNEAPNEFSDWRDAIPPGSTVFVTNGHDSGSFVWFTLERNNYLSPGQSAGVVFSRVTALEVRRRSEVLLPLVDPNWKIQHSLQKDISTKTIDPIHRALTAKSLTEVCNDPALDFLISPSDVGVVPVRHTKADSYRNWILYDCNSTRHSLPKS